MFYFYIYPLDSQKKSEALYIEQLSSNYSTATGNAKI